VEIQYQKFDFPLLRPNLLILLNDNLMNIKELDQKGILASLAKMFFLEFMRGFCRL